MNENPYDSRPKPSKFTIQGLILTIQGLIPTIQGLAMISISTLCNFTSIKYKHYTKQLKDYLIKQL